MARDVDHVQLTSSDFTGDSKFVAWPARERGAYCSLIFYLYQNGGKLAFDEAELGPLCGCHDCFPEVWQNISGKFQLDGTFIKHKRVTAEIRRARAFRKAKQQAGLKGAAKRWQSHADGNGTAMAKVREGKVSKDTTPYSPPKGESPGFLSFWKAYPVPKSKNRKYGERQNCLARWKVWKLEAHAEVILKALAQVSKSHDWTKNEREFVPNPYKWLGKKPWLSWTEPLDSPVKPQMKEEPPDDSTVFARMTPQAVRQKFYQEAERRMPQHENRSLVWGLAQTLWIKAGRPKEAKP